MTLLVMAAGMGSRFGGLKQIEPVGPNGEFILDYSIYDAIKAGFSKVVFIIKRENLEVFKETIGRRLENKIEVSYAFQEIGDVPIKIEIGRTKPWGTGQAILCAKNVVNENFGVINADDFYGRDCFIKMVEYLKEASKKANNYALIGYEAGNTLGKFGAVKRGVCKEKDGYIQTIIESSVERKGNSIYATPLDGTPTFKIKDNDLVSMNALCFTKGLFDYLEKGFSKFFLDKSIDLTKSEYLLPEVIKEMIIKKECDVKLIRTNAVWYGITYKEDKEDLVTEINNMIGKGIYPQNLWH